VKKILGLISFIILIGLLVLGCSAKKDLISINNSDKIKTIRLSDADDQSIQLSLFFDNSENDEKAEVTVEQRVLVKEELLGEIIVQELIKGPISTSELKPIFSKDTRLLSFSVSDNIAYINLSKEVVCETTKAQEEACLKALSLSLCQLEEIKSIKILVENQDVVTLGGNYDITKPFSAETIQLIVNK
jgi:spore germination protein GerM